MTARWDQHDDALMVRRMVEADPTTLARLAALYAADKRSTLQRTRDARLRALTARPEPARDVPAALAKLRGLA